MDFLKHALDVFLHLDRHLDEMAAQMGGWLYAVLFLIIFCETALVVMPFLPGDSLLFAVGALAARPESPLEVVKVILLLFVAAVLGDAVNYSIGLRIGPKVFSRRKSKLFNPDHLVKTQRFYEKYGGKTIIIARFVPIVRTFAPFVAGIGKMRYRRFAAYNVIGGAVWVVLFVVAGYAFGNIEFVKKNFSIVILAIIFVSILPAVIEYLRARRERALPPA